MKKKIKDFTIGETFEICKKHPTFDGCIECPFTDRCPFSNIEENELEEEIEVEENGK